ncbi:MAG: DegV family protein [Thermicanus sp.]|nr:DegV family protein [Thermicanus sp.]
MERIAVVTDSTADIPLPLQEKYSIHVVHALVEFGNETYLDQVEITPASFYERLRKSPVLPKTSQPTVQEFFETYERLLKEYDHVLAIHLSSQLAGDYQTANLVKEQTSAPERITIVDSKSASFGLGAMVLKSAQSVQQGASLKEILALLKEYREKMKIFFLVDTLEYLAKGGRIGKASYLLGTLIQVNPVLTIDREGRIYPYAKKRGMKQAISFIKEEAFRLFEGEEVDLAVIHADSLSQASQLEKEFRAALPVRHSDLLELGPAIGTHTGPGTVGIILSPVLHAYAF